MARKAASSTPAGEPAKVSTVRLWSRSEERPSTLTSLTDWTAATIWSTTSGRRASEKLGMHSMSWVVMLSRKCRLNEEFIFRYYYATDTDKRQNDWLLSICKTQLRTQL